MINNFIFLMTLHFLADFPLQGDFLARLKGSNMFLMMVHAFIWAGMIYSGAIYLGVTENPYWFQFLYFGHWAIDAWKSSRTDKSKALTTHLYIDQFAHLLQIVILLGYSA